MPELPEVETTVRGLRPVLQDRRIVSIDTRREDLRRAFPPDLRQRLTGARVTGLDRRAKYGLIGTDRGDTLVFHLGMSGRWRIDPDAIGAHDHLLIETDCGGRLALNDPRRFGSVDLVRSDGIGTYEPFRRMGPSRSGPTSTQRPWQPRSPGERRRSRLCCSTSGSSRVSATSTSARRCTWLASRPSAPAGGSGASG
jgi:formamidopyrimidine-DNA glycosylase